MNGILAKALLYTGSGVYEPCDPIKATHVRLCFPGPFPNRILPVNNGGWYWNRSETSPTLTPSIRSSDGTTICHSFVVNGVVEFCTDSTHGFAGKSVPLEHVD